MEETNEKKDTVEKEFVSFPVVEFVLYWGHPRWKSSRDIRRLLRRRKLKVLSGETDNMRNIEAWMEEQGIREEDEVTVCELFDQYVRQGRAEGRAEGLAEGLSGGRAEGENRFAKLVKQLMDKGRGEDLRRAVSDQNYREQLYKF